VFQSRFGKAKWLQPYCIETLMALPEEGFKNIDIICPGFVIDCLETLEEINMTNKAIFFEAGGEQYRYIPCLNDSDENVQLMVDLIENKAN
jgi:ferrochelatase